MIKGPRVESSSESPDQFRVGVLHVFATFVESKFFQNDADIGMSSTCDGRSGKDADRGMQLAKLDCVASLPANQAAQCRQFLKDRNDVSKGNFRLCCCVRHDQHGAGLAFDDDVSPIDEGG